MSGHTPGPWKRKSIPGHLFEIHDTQGNPVIRVRSGMMPTHGDAHLIIAAPDLLLACKEALLGCTDEFLVPVLQAAIAKAERGG